jgi:hypothetical protein
MAVHFTGLLQDRVRGGGNTNRTVGSSFVSCPNTKPVATLRTSIILKIIRFIGVLLFILFFAG